MAELMNKSMSEQEQMILIALGEVTAGLIHKMSNSIGHIPVLVNRIERKIDPEDVDTLRKLQQIREGVSDALEFMRSMGRILEVRKAIQIEVDLKLLINDAIQQTRELIVQNAVEIKTDIDNLPSVFANSPLLAEAFRSVINNAVEAMPSGGKLTINGIYDANNSNVVIKIIDTGSGIPEENIDSLFRFGFTTKKDGKGIGLWFSKTVIEQHRGEIEFERNKENGTTFVINLPVSNSVLDGD
jgi:signal transduction histidine kinase